ncbi:MAG: arylsulfatase [Verrucomicrobiota bacterium]
MKNSFKLYSLLCVGLLRSLVPNILAAETDKKPNIIVILADDFGWGSVGCYGGKGLKTPNLDRLAKEGRMFRHAYATGSVCSPTRYALMTGRYYWRTSVKDGKVLPGNGPLHIETNRVTLASLAKQNGYRTAAVGKWHLGLGLAEKTDFNAPLNPGPLSVGFDYFFGLPANIGNPPPIYIENEKALERKGGLSAETIAETKKPKKDFAAPADPSAVEVMPTLVKKSVQWIEANKAQPFFLYFAPNAVHEPIVPTPDFKGSPFGRYGDFISELDWSVGEILKTLDKLKLADNTLVLFTSDNGGVAREQNPNANAAMKAGLAINGILRGGKHDIWEGGFREPFLLRWPGKVPANTTCDDIVSVTDIAASLASIWKTKIPSGHAEDSVDVSGSFFGKGKAARDHIILQDASANYAIRQGDWKLIERENAPAIAARNKKVAAALKRKGTEGHDELYNLAEDPSETKDIAAKHPNIVNRLRQQLAKTREQGFSRQ